MSAAWGLLLYFNPSMLKENSGHIELSKNWALSLLERMKFVKRKATTSKDKESVADFLERKQAFLREVVTTVEMEDVPIELILNWDQTGIKIVPTSNWTMELSGSKRVEMSALTDKRQITAVLCGNMVGDFLPVQLVYQGRTNRCHPRYKFPSEWHISHSPKHWSNEETMLQYVEIIIHPYVESVRCTLSCDSPAVVIMDNFRAQVTQKVYELLDSYNIHTCVLLPNTTDRLQPLDIAVNKPAKDFLRRRFDEWYAQQVMLQLEGKSDEEIEVFDLHPIDLSMAWMKEVSADWLVQMADYIGQNPSFLVNGFIKAGITGALDGLDLEGKDATDEINEDTSADDTSESDMEMIQL